MTPANTNGVDAVDVVMNVGIGNFSAGGLYGMQAVAAAMRVARFTGDRVAVVALDVMTSSGLSFKSTNATVASVYAGLGAVAHTSGTTSLYAVWNNTAECMGAATVDPGPVIESKLYPIKSALPGASTVTISHASSGLPVSGIYMLAHITDAAELADGVSSVLSLRVRLQYPTHSIDATGDPRTHFVINPNGTLVTVGPCTAEPTDDDFASFRS